MNIYKNIVYIKKFFAPNKNFVAPFAEGDAETLSVMGTDARFLRARNVRVYFYYYLLDNANLDVAKYLFARNGLKAKIHNSHYYFYKRPVLRVPLKCINEKPEYMKFVKSIDVAKTMPDFDMTIKKIKTR